jgi:hypothetical protein
LKFNSAVSAYLSVLCAINGYFNAEAAEAAESCREPQRTLRYAEVAAKISN